MRSTERRNRRQQGQAAMEFVLAMVWLIGLCAVIYQALHFELDVFNKTTAVRQKLFHRAHENQDTTDYHSIEETLQGKNLGDLTFYTVPGQSIDSSLHYGPKTVKFRCGTKYQFPGGSGVETAIDVGIAVGLIADHAQDASGHLGDLFDSLASVVNSIPCSSS